MLRGCGPGVLCRQGPVTSLKEWCPLVLLPRLGLGVLLGRGPIELLALRVGQDVTVALQEL